MYKKQFGAKVQIIKWKEKGKRENFWKNIKIQICRFQSQAGHGKDEVVCCIFNECQTVSKDRDLPCSSVVIILSKFFKDLLISQEAWRQFSRRNLAVWGERIGKSLPSICSQTPLVFKPIDYQRITKQPKFWHFCQNNLPIFTYVVIHLPTPNNGFIFPPLSAKNVPQVVGVQGT